MPNACPLCDPENSNEIPGEEGIRDNLMSVVTLDLSGSIAIRTGYRNRSCSTYILLG